MGASARWPIERADKVRDFVARGLSISEIARLLDDGATRNAVMGFMSRAGIKSLNPPGDNRILPADLSKPKRLNTRRKKRALKAGEYRKTLLELGSEHCRYPLFDNDPAGGFFCGAPEADMTARRPYCEFHERICWRESERRPSTYRKRDAA